MVTICGWVGAVAAASITGGWDTALITCCCGAMGVGFRELRLLVMAQSIASGSPVLL